MFQYSELEKLTSIIEKMEKSHHIKILNIIRKNNPQIQITENSNGSFINMNELNKETIDELNNYIDYTTSIEQEIKEQETIKNSILENHINNDINT